MSRIDSQLWKISTGRHFQNGRHNTAKIQHCPISSKFDLLVDNDVPNWLPTFKNFYRSPFLKWPPQYRTNSTLSDFNAISYVDRLWCSELIPDIEKFLPVAIFKMVTTIPHKFNIVGFQRHFMWGDYAVPKWFLTSKNDSRHWKISTGRHFQNGHHNTAQIQHCPISTLFHMWVDYDVPNWFLTLKNFYWSPFSKWPPQYRINSTLSDFNDISYVGRLCCPEMILDIEKFLPIAIFKMATTILHKFNIVGFQRHFICG